MDGKINYAEVLIDGKIYTVGGTEDTGYFQKVAAYINFKLEELRSQPGFSKQSEDYQQLMLAINMADDYFKEKDMADILQRQKEEIEKDIYTIKHDLINTQMKLEEAQIRIQELDSAMSIINAGSVSADLAKEEEERRTVPESAPNDEVGEEIQKVQEEKEQEAGEQIKREEEKQKALEAAKLATEQLLKSRPLPNRGRQTKK